MWITQQGHKAGVKKTHRKKKHQINIKVDDLLHDQVESACRIGKHGEGQLCRNLVEWALPFYEQAGSFEALTAVGMILDRLLGHCAVPESLNKQDKQWISKQFDTDKTAAAEVTS